MSTLTLYTLHCPPACLLGCGREEGGRPLYRADRRPHFMQDEQPLVVVHGGQACAPAKQTLLQAKHSSTYCLHLVTSDVVIKGE